MAGFNGYAVGTNVGQQEMPVSLNLILILLYECETLKMKFMELFRI